MNVFDAISAIDVPDQQAYLAASQRQLRLTKPPFALGQLEEIANRLSAICATVPPPVSENPALAIFAGDHGVLASGVSMWPQEVTFQMVANFLAGGAAVSVLARRAGVKVVVVDIGIASDLDSAQGLLNKKIAKGTADLAFGPAMTMDQAKLSLQIGFDVANQLIDQGHDVLLTGDMGIGNTTPSAALVAYFCDVDAHVATGRGTGIDDKMMAHKVQIVSNALTRLRGHKGVIEPLEVLSEVGGFEHGGLAGYIIGAAYRKVPVILDGVIANSAALLVQALCPKAIGYLFAGHISREPGAVAALEKLGLDPVINLDLALGEGTGAILALGPIASAAALLSEMATFDQAGVSEK